MTIEQDEYTKYSSLYKSKNFPTTDYVLSMAEFMTNVLPPKCSVLELGCGRGQAVDYMLNKGYTCSGLDITSDGVLETHTDIPDWFTKGVVWNLPYSNSSFDYLISNDVMEHIPILLVPVVVSEIYRVTRRGTFHGISSLPNTPYHMTVKPMNFWRDVFSKGNINSIDTLIVDSLSTCALFDFVNNYIYGKHFGEMGIYI